MSYFVLHFVLNAVIVVLIACAFFGGKRTDVSPVLW